MNKFVYSAVEKTIDAHPVVKMLVSELEYLDSLSIDEVEIYLQKILFDESQDDIKRSRAFDALSRMKSIDSVAVLSKAFECLPTDWHFSLCERLSTFSDSRAERKLIEVLQNHQDPDIRCAAAEYLQFNGTSNAIEALRYAVANDRAKDYEGFAVADLAQKTLDSILANPK